MEQGKTSCHFGGMDEYLKDYEYQAKVEFLRRGFSFKPRGYIEGVYQKTQEICW
jgi:hypothetical protein